MEYYVDIPDVDATILKNGTAEQYARPNIRFGACASSDVWISAWGSENTKTMQSIPAERKNADLPIRITGRFTPTVWAQENCAGAVPSSLQMVMPRTQV